jgi:hypothetical protein
LTLAGGDAHEPLLEVDVIDRQRAEFAHAGPALEKHLQDRVATGLAAG